jgi:hypothetical protein
MKLFAAPRTQKHLATWQSPWACSIQDRFSGTRLYAQRPFETVQVQHPSSFLLAGITKYISEMLQNLSLMHIDRTGKREQWPMSLKQVPPFGPESTLCGIFWWLETDLEYTCLHRAIQVLEAIRPAAYPLIAACLITFTAWVSHRFLLVIQRACLEFETVARQHRRPFSEYCFARNQGLYDSHIQHR